MLVNNCPNLKGVRILVVDDDVDNLDFLVFLFEEYDAQVRAVTTANEALKILAHWQPEILISDIAMPLFDGYMLIRTIREMSKELGGKIPAIALTAYAVETDYEEILLNAGFQKYMTKPIEPTTLAIAVAEVVGQNSNI
ncbi:MAG: response regulator [Tolypothrix sp. Co-bin9]|nr:response regulator [Tolypothrix sp. Co-bin9]